MTNPSHKGTLEEETIYEMARRARRLYTCARALLWTALVCLFGMTFPIVIRLVRWHHLRGSSLFYEGILPTLPLLSVAIWIGVEELCTKSVRSKFSAIFTPERSDALPCVSSAAIGPLLDTLMPGAIKVEVLPIQVALLGNLLKSVRTEEEVILTEDQRTRLHDFVIVGRWHWFNLPDNRLLGEEEYRAVRPFAISALAVIGNSSSIPVLG